MTTVPPAIDPEHLLRTCLWPLLRQQAAAAPDAVFFECGGESLTFARAEDHVARLADGLRSAGLQTGERMVILADNSIDALLAWWGANAAGIVDVPVNMEAKGDHLRYLIGDAQPRAIVASAARLAEVAALSTDRPEIAIVLDGDVHAVEGYDRVVSFAALLASDGSPEDVDRAQPRTGDLATIMYTSGTTGPSKGVMLPQGYYAAFGHVMADVWAQLVEGDVVYCAQPLFHIDARMTVCAALCCRAKVFMSGRFSARQFWNDVRACGATHYLYIGTMMWILSKQDARPDDREQPARIGLGSSTPWEIREAFEERFDTTVYEALGMTEGVLLTANDPTGRRHGSVGRAVPVVEIAVVDDQDERLPAGTTGEIVWRSRYPNVLMQGYWNRPEATVERWRNMWFHTGDLGHLDEDGYVYYLGRVKDSIRRRGENVSAWEVEQALSLHDDVLEAAAIGVPSEVGEEDVAAVCVLKAGGAVTPAELHAFVAKDLPRFAVPRYIEFVASLPKTPSERIAKPLVRERGLSAAAWDASA